MIKKLFLPIDNSPLIVFRIFFGLLLALETIGAILTGWVKENLIDPKFTFSYIGMEWLQPLPGYGMYFYFLTMGILGILIMLGWKYRFTLGAFTLLWTGSYLMQKSSYNNHYYLLILVCIIMLFLPANRYASLDAKNNPAIKTGVMPQWCSWVLIFQVAIVYFFAAISKFYIGWIDGSFIKLLFESSPFYYKVDFLFSQRWFQMFIVWSGIAFDLLIVPFLLWKRTRTIAFFSSLVFHLFNAIFLQIGIFPFFALSFVVFFYPPEKIRSWFFKNKEKVLNPQPITANTSVLLYFFLPYFIIQLALPLRHHFIKGDVLWTEEGHRLSWRMMLRQRSGTLQFRVIDKHTNTLVPYNYMKSLTGKQISFVQTKPDGIWQMAQQMKREFQENGLDVAIYADCETMINGGHSKKLIDPTVDLASAEWNHIFHNNWILLYDDNEKLLK